MNPIRRIVLGCLLLITPAFADGNAEIEAILEPIRVKHGIPALAGAVFNREGTTAAAATGLRKAGEKAAVTVKDDWHLGSATKAMTAVLAGTYVAEGKLAWTDTMEKLFPEFAGKIDPALRQTTIAELLSHRAGLVPDLRWEDYDDRQLPKARREASRVLLTSPPASAPGSYVYANSGYIIVGAILEKIGGKPWEKLITDRVFEPLGMKSADFGGTGTRGKLDQPWGHLDSGTPVPENGPAVDNPAMMGPAGTVHTSVDDWAKFLTDQLRGADGRQALLPSAIYATIQAPHPADTGYGLGWNIVRRPWAGGKTLSHAGSNTMNFSICWLSVSKGFGVAVCTNQAGEKAEKAADEASVELIDWYLRKAN